MWVYCVVLILIQDDTGSIASLIALFPGSLLQEESLVKFVRKAVDFWHIILYVINIVEKDKLFYPLFVVLKASAALLSCDVLLTSKCRAVSYDKQVGPANRLQWTKLARRNWEWRLLRSTAVFKATMFSKVFGTQPQGKNWTACEKGQTLRIPTLWVWYVEALLLAMSPERCQPLVRYSWDEGGPSDMINTRIQS